MKKSAPFLVLAAGSMWGCMGVLVRTLTASGLNSMEITALRCVVTCVCVAAFLAVFQRKAFAIRLKDIWCFIGTGILSVTFFSFCYFQTMTLTSLSAAAVLLYTAPTFVMLLSAVLFHERMTKGKTAALFLAFLGCLLVTGVTGEDAVIGLSGILTGLGAGFGYALYSIFGRYALEKGYSSLTVTQYTFLFASIGTLPFVSYPKIAACFMEKNGLIFPTFLLILLTTVAPYFVYTLGLGYMEAGRAAVIASIEPVVATLVGVVIYQEKLKALGAVGVALVISSILLINRGAGRPEAAG